MRLSRLTIWGVALSAGIGGSLANAVVFHNESINGDLSGDRLNPAAYSLTLGINSLIATSNTGDREYVKLTLPPATQLSQLVLSSYAGTDQIAFIGVQAGSTFTEPPTGTNVANLLGWSHFGPGVGNVGQNFLPSVGTGAGSMGFTPPLTGSTYTWWIQQTGASLVTYQLDFVVTPEPATIGIMVTGALMVGRRRICR
jgi:hypothetical protein